MTNCVFGFANLARTATITTSAEVSGLGGGQLANDQGATSTSWQTPAGTTAAWVQLDAGAAQVWGAFGLFNANLTPAATVRWRVSNDPTFATSIYDSGTLSGTVAAGYRQSVLVPTAAAAPTGRYMRADIADAANPEALLRVAQLYAGPVVRPVRNFGYQTAFARAAEAPAITTRGGQDYVELRFARRAWSIALPLLDVAESWSLAQELQRAAEDGRNVLFVPMPVSGDLARDPVLGRLTAAAAVTWPGETAPRRRAWACTITERL